MSDSDSSGSNSINEESAETPSVETRNDHGGLVTSTEHRKKHDDKSEGVSQILELKLPTLGEAVVDEEDNDGFRTPPSIDHKIPLSKTCPPAPRKPKSCPMKKRKSSSSNSIHIRHDLAKEIEAMIPDLSHKIKKPRSI